MGVRVLEPGVLGERIGEGLEERILETRVLEVELLSNLRQLLLLLIELGIEGELRVRVLGEVAGQRVGFAAAGGGGIGVGMVRTVMH